MASLSFSTYSFLIIILFLLGRNSAQRHNGLKGQNYYFNRCRGALNIIQTEVRNAIAKERRIGASLLRLHFHDCFGCDGSVLLDDDPKSNFTGEKSAFPNVNSIRGFEVIDTIKRRLENKCPGVVSCADILAVAARDSVDALRPPASLFGIIPLPFRRTTWKVELGRRDSRNANVTDANRNLPPPFFNLQNLTDAFSRKGFTARELVVLSGGHTVGKARCTTFRSRIYNESNINPVFAAKLRRTCPSQPRNGDDNLAPLDDPATNSNVDFFDNGYFKDLVRQRGLLHSDQQLFINGGQTNAIVRQYSRNPKLFLNDFGKAMVKMGRLSPLIAPAGEIRRICRRMN
ncbi:Plant peroxidase [Parasponia andersonii]|uniref:Peroxidase n=1 Tax=Parasponia andersonii TaxID=3476 RepID=A0A2P5BDP3_PARAD|nr:Plant peroxidase [Parasponia andersonii]